MIFVEAILSSVLSAITASLVGYYAEKLRVTTLSFCITHAALAGASLGLALGFDPTYSGMALSVTAGCFLGWIATRIQWGEVIILSLFSFFSSVALVAIYLANKLVLATTTLSMVLWGSVLTADWETVSAMAGVLGGFLVYLRFFKGQINSMIFDPELAKAEGVDVERHTLCLLTFIGIVVSLTLRLTGGFLIFSLLYIPVASALHVADVASRQILSAVGFAVASSMFGFFVSYKLDLPIGSSITMVATGILFLSVLWNRSRSRVKAPKGVGRSKWRIGSKRRR